MAYDESNIFAKILRGEIPCQKVFEDDFALCFRDINPQAPIHVLIIPKGRFKDASDFFNKAKPEEIAGMMRAVARAAKELGVEDSGYRILANQGQNAGQEVPHFHVHLFAGRALGPMLT